VSSGREAHHPDTLRVQVKDALKKLACGIPIKDAKNEIIGWQEKPDIKAIEEINFYIK
jgi:phosphoribosylformimino-5-aminoimidazole carboxamide ribonucleotide (ProFAR) isomerase